ncbi:MBL fold metallo-hydrolase [Oscillibacter sp.]|uniref:MBL fold metallo-hydrolase n=1 Tax=Oscillibacter sp. TaxID=1945593 RepID=UPI002D7FC271|nr:MBL fold metallo-hydrolase [Oscillibacter sp.]
MTRVTFLSHSGFLVELDSAALLFDWWKGELPDLPLEVPLYIFASHVHPDHFSPKIFSLDDGSREVRFILGHDIKPGSRNSARWGLSPATAAKCQSLRGGEALELPRARVEALPSTDEGEAFLVTADGLTVFHAGDLNWWHWEGEDKAWNRNMEVNFKRYTEPLRGRNIDLAMLPLDPRLGEAGFWGPAYFLETADIRRFLPMHQWGKYDFTRKFLEKYPAFTDRTVLVERAGQAFAF